MTYQFDAFERLQLLVNVLPAHVGALDELLAIERLREKLIFSKEEKERVGYVEQQGAIALQDQEAARDLPTIEVDLTEEEERVLALGFKLLEAKRGEDRKIPSNQGMSSAYRKLHDVVSEIDV